MAKKQEPLDRLTEALSRSYKVMQEIMAKQDEFKSSLRSLAEAAKEVRYIVEMVERESMDKVLNELDRAEAKSEE